MSTAYTVYLGSDGTTTDTSTTLNDDSGNSLGVNLTISGNNTSLDSTGADSGTITAKEVKVVLKDKTGTKVKEVVPEFDGFYIIEKVKPGDYKLTIELPEGIETEVKLPLVEVSIKAKQDPQ